MTEASTPTGSFTLGDTEVSDTFAEAFPMRYARLIITAATREWAHEAARSATGFATSVIGCKCEAAIECPLTRTPDGRPGVSVLLFAMDREGVGKRVLEPLFGERYTVAFEHYPVRDPALREPARIVEAAG